MNLDEFDSTGLDLTTLLLCDYANIREGMLNIVSGGITRIATSTGFPSHIDAHLAMSVYVHPHRINDTHNGRIIFRYPDTVEEIARIEFQFHGDAQLNPGEGLNFHFALPLQSITAMKPGQIDVSVTVDESPLGLISFWMSDASGEAH
jgi:hypothetical protein